VNVVPAERQNSERRLEVAIVSFDFGDYCIPIANALSGASDVHLLLPETEVAPLRSELSDAVHLRLFHKPRLRQAVRQLRMCLQLVRALREIDPDIIHVQQGHLWFNLFLPFLRRYPTVFTVHDHRHHVGDAGSRKTPLGILHFGFRHADQLIVHGGRLKREVVTEVGVAEDRVHVIRSLAMAGVEAALQGNGNGSVAAGGAETIVLFFGRIWPYKGLEYLIRAEPQISRCIPDLKIVVAGEGEDFDRYRRLMKNPRRFLVHNEYVSNEKRAELFTRANVVVLPYIEATQSGVVPIAYAYGKPVVTTSVGGLPEHVEDGQTGFVVPPRDEAALAEAVIRLLQDSELARRFGAAGRARIDAECSAGSVARKTLTVYERALPVRSEDKVANGL
jgi:glycosyltransferase involved in cell wall biosynthesis